jgi:hypothetical protein
MGRRVLIFCQEHPTMSAGYARSVARLEYLVHRAEQLFGQQMDGRTQVRAAAERKFELRRGMKLAHIPHLAAAAEAASREEPELQLKFRIPRSARPFTSFLVAARTIEALALDRRELLEENGMAQEVLEDFSRLLGEYEQAMRDLASGRMSHVGARADLEEIAREIDRIVKLLDGFYRVRLGRQDEALAAWNSAKRTERRRQGETESRPDAA